MFAVEVVNPGMRIALVGKVKGKKLTNVENCLLTAYYVDELIILFQAT